jgi:hypothetical protein
MSLLKTSMLACFFAAASAAVWAAEDKKAEHASDILATIEKKAEKPAAEATADEIAQWIKQLDADKFTDRQAASEKLHAAGKAAIPALTKAAGGDSLEMTVRSIDLLQRFMGSDDKAVKDAAKEALEKIAESPKAGTARRAKQALNPEQEPEPQFPMGVPQMIPNGLMPNGVGVSKSVSISNANGVKDIKVEEGDRKIHITVNADKSIKMEITEKKDGKDDTKKYEAKKPDELKKKSPKAYETYKEYAEGEGPMGGVLQLNTANGTVFQLNDSVGGAGVGMAVPVPGGMPLGRPVPLQPGLGPQASIPGWELNNAKLPSMRLQGMNEMLKITSKNLASAKLQPEDKKELKDQIDELKEQLDELKKQLDEDNAKPK